MHRVVRSPSRFLLVLPFIATAVTFGAAQPAHDGTWHPPDLVDAVASFGVVVHDGALYVYGGHVGRVHAHSVDNISPGFRRLVLAPGQEWEDLAAGPRLQGTALVSYGDSIYRIGGMAARTAKGEDQDREKVGHG